MRTCTYNLQYEAKERAKEPRYALNAEQVQKTIQKRIEFVQKNFFCPCPEDKCRTC